jgi:tryptophanyl-tRNA synthetase
MHKIGHIGGALVYLHEILRLKGWIMAGQKKIILSGNRPTGKLHLGNYTGALENWVSLQKGFTCYFMVADWHVLTTYEHTDEIPENTREMIIDWISAGLDPEKSTLFVQSHIKEHAELFLILSMLVSKARLERNPTLKEQIKDLNLDANISYGHLGYPVLQASDILIYRAHFVPVGEDQLPHIEITREIARKFNRQYGTAFPVPQGKLTKFPRFPGLDGRRMSKSLGNTIEISDSPDTIRKKINTAFTDPARKRRSDPGHPEVCLIYTYWQKFGPEQKEEICDACSTAKIGCVECKHRVAEVIIRYLEPLHQKRRELEKNPRTIDAIIRAGDDKARSRALETMADVREKMKIG